MPSSLLAIVLLNAALAAPLTGPTGTPSAADVERAKQLYDNGADLYEEASYRDAIAAWTEAYRLSGKPDLLYNIANAHERLAQYADAIEAISTYRAFATAEERELLDRRMRNLEKLQAESVARVAPAPVPAPVPEPVAPAPAPVPKPKPERTGSGSGQRVGGAVLLGVGGVGLVSAAALGLLSNAAGSRAQAQCVDGLCPVDASADLQSNKNLALWSDVSLAAGVVSAGVGVGLVATAGRGTMVSVRFDF